MSRTFYWRLNQGGTTKAGLIEVALPHHRVPTDGRLLAALWRLPEFYEPVALDALALGRAA